MSHTSFTDNEVLGKFNGEAKSALAKVTLQQLLAASAMIVSLEKICASGALAQADEQNLRVLILKACKAFEISPLAERGSVVPFPGSEVSA